MSKYEKLSPTILRRIEAHLCAASYETYQAGLFWYASASATAKAYAKQFGLPHEAVCGIIAALSPGQEWTRNLASTRTCLEYAQQGRTDEIPLSVSVYGRANVLKVQALIAGDSPLNVLSGPKVKAFYECLYAPNNQTHVVIDRHARCAALGLERSEANASVRSYGEYKYLARHYARVAQRIGIAPCQVQAIVWEHWREAETASRFKGNEV